MADRKRAAHRPARRPVRASSTTRGRSRARTRTRAHRRKSRLAVAAVGLRRRRVLVRLLLGGMVIVALLFAFVFPARTLLAQRQQTKNQRQRLELLREQTRKLEVETRRLQNDAEIERIARDRYNFVRPGEHPYVVVPPPTPAPTTTAPSTTSPARPGSKP